MFPLRYAYQPLRPINTYHQFDKHRSHGFHLFHFCKQSIFHFSDILCFLSFHNILHPSEQQICGTLEPLLIGSISQWHNHGWKHLPLTLCLCLQDWELAGFRHPSSSPVICIMYVWWSTVLVGKSWNHVSDTQVLSSAGGALKSRHGVQGWGWWWYRWRCRVQVCVCECVVDGYILGSKW